MDHLTASTSAIPFSGKDWFDPLEEAVRFRIRAFIEAMVEEEAEAALGGRKRYQRNGPPKGYRNGHRERQLVGTFGAVTVSLPRARLLDQHGREKEWRSHTIQAYKRLTKQAEVIIANAYLGGTNTRRVRRSLAGLFGGKVGKDAVSRAWRKVKTDWQVWQARDLSGEDIVRLILDGTGVKARLDRRVTSIPLLVAVGVRRDGQKVLLAVNNMGGETEAAWRCVLDDLLARGLKAPELLIVDGGKGLEAALASLWSDIPVQRCTVHKERNLLAHAPKQLHDEIKADYTDMMYAKDADEVLRKRKAFLAKWRLRCQGVAGQPGGSRRSAVHLPALSSRPMEILAHNQCHRTPARGVQAPDQNPMRAAQRGDRGHAVLGVDGVGADHHAQGRWLANAGPSPVEQPLDCAA